MGVPITPPLSQYPWPLFVAAIVSYIVTTCAYRRFFHPLAKILGPLLPAVTKLYQSAYKSRYYLRIAEMQD